MVGTIAQRRSSGNNSKIAFDIDDGTGIIECVQWLTQEEKNVKIIQEGKYVHIIGTVQCSAGVIHIVIVHIEPVQDCNQIIYHNLYIIRNCHHLKNNPPPVQPIESSSSSSLDIPIEQMDHPLKKQQQTLNFSSNNFIYKNEPTINNNNNNNQNNNNVKGGRKVTNSEIYNRIIQYIQNSTSPSGVHINEIIDELKVVTNIDMIQNAINFLSEEGQLYNTIDDNTFGCSLSEY